jgi:anti-anti-sigma regulatory factor
MKIDQASVTAETQNATDVAPIVLPPICTIGQIAALHECLRAGPRHGPLDGSAVQQIDAAGLQLLLQFSRYRRAGCAMSWTGVSAALRSTVFQLGLSNAINLPSIH